MRSGGNEIPAFISNQCLVLLSRKNLDLRLPETRNTDAGHLAGGGRTVGFREGDLVSLVVIFLLCCFEVQFT